MQKTIRDDSYYNFTFRERFNFYAGLAIGTLTPIVLARFTLFNHQNYEKGGVLGEVYGWAGAIGAAICPLPITSLAGIGVGMIGAFNLREQRHKKIKELEAIVEN